MRIRAKTILVVLPLIVTPLLVLGIVSYLAARNAVTGVATSLLRFKAEELATYAESQRAALEQNNLADKPQFVELAKAAVASHARALVRSDTEIILAVGPDGVPAFTTTAVALVPAEQAALAALARAQADGWQQLALAGVPRVAWTTGIPSYQWQALVTESRTAFYEPVGRILSQGGAILVVAAAAALALLFVFAGYLTRPLRLMVQAMRGIMSSTDLSRRVDPLYRDETGDLAHAFNQMTDQLDQAYSKIKSYALETAIARKREQKIRSIFQRYVPNEVIEEFFRNPERMLVGDNRELAVLFSDIRGFVSFSERLKPDEVVESLNAYFTLMVDVITSRRGIVDKYMGDAIMAFFGAPVKHGDDAWQAVQSAFDMLQALRRHNQRQVAKGRPPFRIGIGINYGLGTVGNIGSDKKMDYTVIGSMVNLAQRMEELTKVYRQPIVFSESVRRPLQDRAPCRRLDRVAVRGIRQGVDIWTARRSLSEAEQEAWGEHAAGMELYFKRDFAAAVARFQAVQRLLPGDVPSRVLAERCKRFERTPPPAGWTGVVSVSAEPRGQA